MIRPAPAPPPRPSAFASPSQRPSQAFLAALPLQPGGLQASVLRRRVEAVERGPARPTATTHSAVKQEEPAQATPPL